MRINAEGLALIKSFESLRLESYLPTQDDVPTIGYGHTGHEVKLGQVITEAHAEELLRKDLALFEAGVTEYLGDAKTSDNQFSAMVCLAFNIGLKAFKNSTVLRCHRAGKSTQAQAAFHLWNKQAGKILAGLVRRRKAEAELYGKG